MHLYHSKNFWKAPWKSSCVSVSITFVTASFISSIVSKRQPLCLGNKKKSQGAKSGLVGRLTKLSWSQSWSNSLWQGWSCGLVYCPGGNTSDPIWRVLAYSQGISSWTPVKPQHSNPNPGVLTTLLLPHLSSSLTDSLPSLNLLCHSKTHARFMQGGRKAVWSIPYVSVASFFPSLKQNFIAYRSSKVSSIQIAFLKFTSWHNQALVGCIPIAAVAVHLKLKS